MHIPTLIDELEEKQYTLNKLKLYSKRKNQKIKRKKSKKNKSVMIFFINLN